MLLSWEIRSKGGKKLIEEHLTAKTTMKNAVCELFITFFYPFGYAGDPTRIFVFSHLNFVKATFTTLIIDNVDQTTYLTFWIICERDHWSSLMSAHNRNLTFFNMMPCVTRWYIITLLYLQNIETIVEILFVFVFNEFA